MRTRPLELVALGAAGRLGVHDRGGRNAGGVGLRVAALHHQS